MKKKFLGVMFIATSILVGCQKTDISEEKSTEVSKKEILNDFFFVEKGDSVSKNVYRDKPYSDKIETIVATSEMQKEIPLKTTMGLTPYVTDLYIMAGDNSNIFPPEAYTKIGIDLNEGAGGKYIYLCYSKYDFANPLQGLELYSGKERLPNPEISNPWKNGVVLNNAGFIYPGIDLNWGSGGDYIYLYQTRVAGLLNPYEGYKPWTKITAIGVYSSNSSSSSQVPYGWKRIPVDLNKGAGGKYIYIIYKTE